MSATNESGNEKAKAAPGSKLTLLLEGNKECEVKVNPMNPVTPEDQVFVTTPTTPAPDDGSSGTKRRKIECPPAPLQPENPRRLLRRGLADRNALRSQSMTDLPNVVANLNKVTADVRKLSEVLNERIDMLEIRYGIIMTKVNGWNRIRRRRSSI